MPTTMHIPQELLRRVDVQAKTRNVSRNRFVVDALRRTLDGDERWSPEFLRALDALPGDEGMSRAVDEMLEAVRSRRASKRQSPL